MTINLDAYKAHVEITVDLSNKDIRDSTYFNVLCFHLVQIGIEESRSSDVIEVSNLNINFPQGSADFSEDSIKKVTNIANTFFLQGGKAMMFLITDENGKVSAGDKKIVEGSCLSIASEKYNTLFETLFAEHILYEFTDNTTRVNKNPRKCVFFSTDSGFLNNEEATDNLLMLAQLFSKQNKDFVTNIISYSDQTLTKSSNGILAKDQILFMAKNGMSFFEIIDTPNGARFGNFMIGQYTDMGMYLFLWIKVEVEQKLDLAIKKLKYNALSLREGGYVNGRVNPLAVIDAIIHNTLRKYANDGLIEENFKVIVPDQEDKTMRIITGVRFGYDPVNTILRMELVAYSVNNQSVVSLEETIESKLSLMASKFSLSRSNNQVSESSDVMEEENMEDNGTMEGVNV